MSFCLTWDFWCQFEEMVDIGGWSGLVQFFWNVIVIGINNGLHIDIDMHAKVIYFIVLTFISTGGDMNINVHTLGCLLLFLPWLSRIRSQRVLI
jgi:hypothetical protein